MASARANADAYRGVINARLAEQNLIMLRALPIWSPVRVLQE